MSGFLIVRCVVTLQGWRALTRPVCRYFFVEFIIPHKKDDVNREIQKNVIFLDFFVFAGESTRETGFGKDDDGYVLKEEGMAWGHDGNALGGGGGRHGERWERAG